MAADVIAVFYHCFVITVSFSGSSRARTTSVTSPVYDSGEGMNSGCAEGPRSIYIEWTNELMKYRFVRIPRSV